MGFMNHMTDKQKDLFEYLIIMVITAVITLGVMHFIQISRVVGESMENTYHNKNIVLVNKTTYELDDVKYKDVVVVDASNYGLDEQIIKRVIGTPGDHIVIKDNELYINDQKMTEDYIKEPMVTSDLDVTVPEGCIFVMGDNRNNSTDSRILGCIEFNDVVGHVFYKIPFLNF